MLDLEGLCSGRTRESWWIKNDDVKLRNELFARSDFGAGFQPVKNIDGLE